MRPNNLAGFGLLLLAIAGLAACGLVGCERNGREVPPSYAPKVPLARWDNSDWREVLEAVVTADGYVKYDVLAGNAGGVRDALYRYVAQVNGVSPENRPELFPAETDKLAYYLNAYNALAMYGVLSEGQLPQNVFAAGLMKVRWPVGGKAYTLDELQNGPIASFGEPRIHFAVNAMARSSPPLRREPYVGSKLDDQLFDQGKRFLADPRGARKVDDLTVALNEIFTGFYTTAFTEPYARRTGVRNPGLLEVLRAYAGPDSPLQQAGRYQTMPFDWSLNRAGR